MGATLAGKHCASTAPTPLAWAALALPGFLILQRKPKLLLFIRTILSFVCWPHTQAALGPEATAQHLAPALQGGAPTQGKEGLQEGGSARVGRRSLGPPCLQAVDSRALRKLEQEPARTLLGTTRPLLELASPTSNLRTGWGCLLATLPGHRAPAQP